MIEKESVYSTLIKRLVADDKLTALHRKYLFEACSVGSSGNMMAATMMLGCAVENFDVFFSIFEIIRMTRNDVGYPTGKILSKEKFTVQLSAYVTVLNQYQKLLEGLVNVKVEINNSII